MFLFAAPAVKHTIWHALRRLGGPGLILIGLVDNSVIPVPGGMDVFTILLAMSHKDLWWYYALMATIGSLIGGYMTYRMGAKGGKETLEKKVSKKRAEKVYKIFERYGFWSIAVGALCPPPFPIAPFLLAPGALHYPRGKFLTSLALGRSIRYTLVAYLGSIYGHKVFGWMFRYYRPLMYVVVTLGVVGGLIALYYWRRYKQHDKSGAASPKPARKAA